MNILADENISRLIVEQLRKEKHQVQYIFEIARGSNDTTVLDIANQQMALLITSDKDFGELVFRQRREAAGVLLVRLSGLLPSEEAEVVVKAIKVYNNRLLHAFTVLTPRGIRIHPIQQ